MAILVPKKVVLNWFRYDVSFSFELIAGFVEGIENLASDSIDNYKSKLRGEVIEKGQDDERLINVHQGLDSETWDLEGVFEQYFPSLQRCSALVAVSSYFEYELNSLCLLFQSEKGFQQTFKLKDKGIDRSINYLARVAKLDVHKGSKEWAAIKRIQKIRNLIVHQNGRLRDPGGKYTKHGKEVADLFGQVSFLRGEKEIVIERGFLKCVLDTYWKYLGLIGDSIHASQNISAPA